MRFKNTHTKQAVDQGYIDKRQSYIFFRLSDAGSETKWNKSNETFHHHHNSHSAPVRMKHP